MLVSIQRRQKEVAPGPESAIYRLPPEVLFIIFDNVRAPSHGQRPFGFSYTPTLENGLALSPPDYHSLVSATHLCRRWREAALEFASLWTNIMTRSSSALTFARRANRLPLTVYTETVVARLPPVQKIALRCLKPRIRRLILRLRSRIELKLFRSILAVLAGTLQSLVVIIGRPWSPCVYPDYEFDPLFRGWTLFDGAIPTALKSLLIASDQSIVPADSCPNLRSLTLETPCWSAHPSTPSLLIRFLSYTLLLEDLRWDVGCWSAEGRQDNEPLPPPAPLHQLRSLSLRAGFQGIVWSDLVSPASSSRSRMYRSSKLTDLIVDVDGSSYNSLVRGRSRVAPHLHVRMATVPELGVTGNGEPELAWHLPRWVTASTETLRITLSRSGPDFHGTLSFVCLNAFRLLDTLIVRLAVGGFYLAQLSSSLSCADPPTCPFLRVLALSILNPRCTLDALHSLYTATTRRAELGHPLKRLFVCSPIHAGPDYSVRDVHGVEWVTYSSTDVGAPCRDFPRFTRVSDGGSTASLPGRPLEEPLPFSAVYDAAWEACATEGLVETHARMRWYGRSRLW